jgi:long-chain acyl-CoA synthetase
MVVVPRLFEVLRQRILKNVEKQGRLSNYLMRRALEIGAKGYQGSVPLWDRPMEFILQKTLRPKISQRFGGRIKAMVSGGAPLNPDVGDILPLARPDPAAGLWPDGSGAGDQLQPARAGIKMARSGRRSRTPKCRVAEDGELLVRGELVMKGYWRDRAQTERTVIDGWLHTGDVGHI